MEKFDFSVFTHPRILYTERELGFAGLPSARATTDTNDLKASRDILIDYIWIGDDGNYKYGGLFNQSLLADLHIGWQIADRAPWFPQELVPATALQNWWDCDRTQVPTVPSFLYPQAVWMWRHTLRWVYNPAQQFRFDWQVRGSQGGGIPPHGPGGGGVDFGLGLHGVSLRTGHRRVFGVGGNIPPGPGGIGVPPATGSFVNPNGMGNISDEPYLIEGLGIVFNRQTWQDGDTRWLNWVYVKAVPTQGEPWSDVPIPLACYGIHQGIARRGAFYKPPGGPILVKAGQSVVFQLENTNPNQSMLAQIALIGRTAPGYGSLY